MGLHEETGLRADGATVVVEVGAVRRAYLAEPCTTQRHHVGHAEAATDLDQLAARDDDLAARRERCDREQDRGRVVVDHQRRLGSGEGTQVVRDQGIPITAPASGQVELEVDGATRGDVECLNGGLGERRPAEVGVQHDAGRVDDTGEPRQCSRLELGSRPPDQELVVGTVPLGSSVRRSSRTRGAHRRPAPAANVRRGRRRAQQSLDRQDGPVRWGRGWTATSASCPAGALPSTARRPGASPCVRAGCLLCLSTMQALVCDLNVPRQVVSSLLGRIDKRFFLGPFSPAGLREIPEPSFPADDWLVLRTRVCGICGSDYKQIFLNGSMDNPMTALISFPQVLGHEVVGTVERIGPGVRNRRVGERVVLNPWLSCGPRGIAPPCPECQDGQYSICRNFGRGVIPPGIHTGNSSAATGGFAPFVPAHESMCIPIPDGVRDDEAVLADPFSVSFHAVLKRPPAAGAPVLIYGCGTLGLITIAILRLVHPASRILAVARFPHQRELAERFGAHVILPHEPVADIVKAVARETGGELLAPWYGMPWIHGGGVDVVYDTVGYPQTVEVGLRVAASRGAVVITGVEIPRRFEWTPLYFKEVAIIGSNAFGVEEFEGRRAHAMEIYLELVRSHRIDVTAILTHRFTLDDYREAFLACGEQGSSGAVKVLFTYDGDERPGASRN